MIKGGLKTGDYLEYGFNDPDHAIDCQYTGEMRISCKGEISIAAKTADGSMIYAGLDMFRQMNGMCNGCRRLKKDCGGTFNPVYTGCIYKEV